MIWLCWVSAVARRIFVAPCGILIVACGIFSCGMQAPSWGTRDPAPRPGVKPCHLPTPPPPCHWECRASTTGLPGRPLVYNFFWIISAIWGEPIQCTTNGGKYGGEKLEKFRLGFLRFINDSGVFCFFFLFLSVDFGSLLLGVASSAKCWRNLFCPSDRVKWANAT